MMSRKKKKNKRDKKKRTHPARPRIPSLPPGMEIRMTPPGGEKMSEVLEAFIEPYTDPSDSREELKLLLTAAVVAWNMALIPSGERETMLRELLATVPPDQALAMKPVIDELVQRKLAHFPENKRFVVSFDLTTLPDGGYYLSVASTPHST